MGEKKYGLVGCPLGHSYSPSIHKALGGYDYRLIELDADKLAGFFESRDFDGLNITVPYKVEAMRYCDELSPQAKRIGCVNTVIKRRDGTLFGHNTDYDGFAYMLSASGVTVKGKKTLVLGTGGASKTVRTVLRDMEAGQIISVSRSGAVSYENVYEHDDAEIIINATPVGMYPDNSSCLIDPARFPKLEFAGDVIYNPARTLFLQKAQMSGIKTANGLGMLVSQARASSELFTGGTISDDAVEREIVRLRQETENIVICGMPGSGKSMVGRLLAKHLDRDCLDTDELICAHTGRSPEEIIRTEGEKEFRRIEKKIVADQVKKNGKVISLGGGAVLDEESRLLVKQNSVVIWLERKSDKLEISGRPISAERGLEALYAERAPVYEYVSDHRIENSGSPENAVNAIIKEVFR